jgi:hypothetical protein
MSVLPTSLLLFVLRSVPGWFVISVSLFKNSHSSSTLDEAMGDVPAKRVPSGLNLVRTAG